MPCFGKIPKIEFKLNFDKTNFSVRKFRKCVGKEAFYSCAKKQELLLKRQRKAQKKCRKKLMKQQRKREKQLLNLKRAACCLPSPCKPSPRNPPPCNPNPSYPRKYNPSPCYPLTCDPTPCNPPPCNPSPSNPPPCSPYPGNPPPSKPAPCEQPKAAIQNQQPYKIESLPKFRRISPCKIKSAVCASFSCRSSSDCCCSSQEPGQFQAGAKNRPILACLSSSGPIKVNCKCKKKIKKKKCKRNKPRNLCLRCMVCCALVGTIAFSAGWSIPILAGLIPAPSLSTCAQCDFVLEPPKRSGTELQRQKPCLGLDKLIQEERENQEWNVAFQKALVKRLEASERRLTLDDYLDDDDDRGSGRGRKKRRRKEAETITDKKRVKTEKVNAEFPDAEEVFKEKKCPCSTKIRREERKRKLFVKIMEREQMKFEKRSLRAQRRYERDKMKAYKNCENTQLAMERGYFKRNKDGVVDKAEETFSVFVHMDPGQCGCKGRGQRAIKCKKCFFKCCVWLYIIGFIVFFVTAYFLTKI